MSKRKHTPGPWVRDAYQNVIGLNGKRVMFDQLSLAMCSGKEREEVSANSELAISAPELLDALVQAEICVAELCEGQHPENECWNTLRTVRCAIAKAEGRT